MLVGGVLGVASVIGMYFYLKPDLPSVDVLKDVQLQTPMRIYTQDGKLISQYGVKRRIPVSIEEVPETLIQAVIATEDSRFYDHYGVDPIGVVRAALNLIVTGEKGQGASTLTMQVARGFFLNRRKEFSRKLKELFIAIHMEQVLTKEEILLLYLNKVELGHRAFGVGAAARVYYGKALSELNLAQLSTIAGLYQAPSRLNPISNPEASVKRRRIVLLRMLDEGYIDRAEFDEAAAAPVTAKFHGAEIELDAPYLADIIYNEMVGIYGKEIAETSGFNVYATATSKGQKAAQFAVTQNLHDYDERHGYRGPIDVLWRPLDDEIIKGLGIELPLSADDAERLNEELGNYQPLSTEEIDDVLLNTDNIGELVPAVVTQVDTRAIEVYTLSDANLRIEWDGLDWARPYVTDYKQGPDPEEAKDIVHAGMLVYIRKRKDDQQWQLAQFPDVSGAFVSLNPLDGAVQAVVGGYDFYHSQFNRATQAKRQVGSNIKPFIYSAALDNGYTIASIINDAPVNQWDASSGLAWRPKNSDAIYDGPVRMRYALGRSKNVVSIRLLRGVGLDNTREYLTKFGFQKDEIPRDETMSLGSGGHTPLEVATALAIIANGGFGVQPYFIQRIENAESEVLWEAEPLYACDPCSNTHLSNADIGKENEANVENEALEQGVGEALPEDGGDLEALLAAEFGDSQLPETEVLEEKPMLSAPRVISEQTAFLVREMMRSAVRANGSWNNKTYWLGTGWRARNHLQRTDIGGKTGTTNEAKDTWFSGFAPGYVATAWVGFDDNSRELGKASRNQNLINKNPKKFNWLGNAMIGGEDGAKAAQPAWIRFMLEMIPDVPEQAMMQPEGIVRVRIDRKTGKLTRRTDASSMFEYFVKGTEPTTFVSENEMLMPVEELKTDAKITEENLITDDIF